ncbi:MAG TPA: hypothetical protein V6D23_22455 [Candidatus Obscuribacterales bacterium]
MPSVQFNQFQALSRALDTNSNQKLEELNVSDELAVQIDSDHNGELSTAEVATALQADKIDIVGLQIVPAQRKDILVPGLETMKNVHKVLDQTLSAPHVWAPRVGDGIGAAVEVIGFLAGAEDKRTPAQQRRDRERELESSSRAYLLAVSSMRSTLRSVADMTRGATDSRSVSLHKQAESALSRSGAWTAGSLVGALIFGSAEAENTAIQAAYNAAKVTMVAMREQTKNLPDPATTLKQTNDKLGQGFANLNQIRRLQSGADARSNELQKNASQADARVTGRTGPFAGTGAVLGAIAGGAAGYFMYGKNIKTALIGAGIGAAGTAGIAAMIGSGIDHKYLEKASTLRSQAAAVKAYKPDQAEKQLDGETVKLYQQQHEAAKVRDLDQATVADSQLKGTQQRVDLITGESQKILNIYNSKN